MPDLYGSNDYSPTEIAERVEGVGVAKARLPALSMAALGVLAGGFIGFGALFYTIVACDPALGFAAKRVLGGVVFSLGLILVVVAAIVVPAWLHSRKKKSIVPLSENS